MGDGTAARERKKTGQERKKGLGDEELERVEE